jgi:GT2 family glycosyltransferase
MLNKKTKDFSFSIIIPTHNRPVLVEKLIQTLLISIEKINNEYDYEIIICDDSSNSLTKELVTSKFKNIIWTKGPQRGPGANRNSGVCKAKYTWLMFIDDDCYVNEEFMLSYFNLVKSGNHHVLEGKIFCPDKKNSIFARQPDNDQGGVLASANFSIRKEVFARLGGFDEDLEIMEDIEFAYRVKNAGYNIVFCKDAIAYHPSQYKPLIFYWKWIFHIRWKLLLDYKCGNRNIGESIIFSQYKTIYDHFNSLLRMTYHLFTKHDKERWVMYTFERLLGWLTIPICIPYIIYWNIIYRSKITKDQIRFHRLDASK